MQIASDSEYKSEVHQLRARVKRVGKKFHSHRAAGREKNQKQNNYFRVKTCNKSRQRRGKNKPWP